MIESIHNCICLAKEAQKKYENFPPIVHIENTNRCNGKCIHCPHSDHTLIEEYKPQNISKNTIEKIIDEIKDKQCMIRLTPDGEPFIDGGYGIELLLALIWDNKTATVNTNGYYLDILTYNIDTRINYDTEDYKSIISKNKIIIEISLDALYRETYDKIRIGIDYNKVLANIFDFLNMIKKYELQDSIKVVVSIIDQPEVSMVEIMEFKKFWSQIVDYVIIRKYVNTKGLMPNKSKIKNIERWPCPVPFTRMVVDYTGGIRFCPDDWLKKTTIADMNYYSIAEIWEGEFMEDLRNQHITGNITNSVCKECTDWQGIQWGDTYLDLVNKLFDNKGELND
jgi:wyosine [tRNA(Phe)-imidazoG37] synthetase (radical SAM superfamily)